MSHAEESTPHVLAGCSALAQTKYLARHNSLWVAKKLTIFPPWFSPTEPKTVDQNQRAKAYWDELVYAKNTEVRVNTIDVRKINKGDNKVRKTEKQGVGEDHEICATSSVLSSRCRSVDPGVIISITVDVLGGASMNTAKSIKALMRERPGKKTLRKMKKSVLSHSLNIARSFKILT